MNVRCPYCRHTFNLSPDYIALMVPKAQEKKHKYHPVECINCRKQIKVSVAQMQRFMPSVAPAAPAEPEAESKGESVEREG